MSFFILLYPNICIQKRKVTILITFLDVYYYIKLYNYRIYI
ncbi:hypothetical protein CLOHYLEM_04183 [[Clostridium] hylemonae DSM 15053]|uniref:Uncharacterized protein n=1 Tax=[Clostridium] hylemonae DSM 15053 TaxID=553973 RepID=C0BWK0_9FIRM|nr:hypothetical protein CLOHYLEM_04183 [[Clostridium] hylemonae DSM 15053]